MNTKKDEALKLALEALETCGGYPEQEFDFIKVDSAITAIREALAEPEMAPAFRSSRAYTVGFQDGKAQALAEQPAQQEPKILGSTAAEIHDAIDEAHELGGPLHERIKKLVEKAHAKQATRTDQQIVDQTEELAVWLLSWGFNRQTETSTPMRESDHPIAKRCWAAACHIQEMLTATDPENAFAELDDSPQPTQPQEPVAARHIGWDYLDNGTLVATYAVPVPEQIAPRLYTSPPASKPWVGLTDGERLDAERLADQQYAETRGQELRPSWASLFCRAIEAKLREKNAAPCKPLRDEQIEREWQFLHDEEGNQPDHHDFARAIETAHKIGIEK